jgi:hypothetical protein
MPKVGSQNLQTGGWIRTKFSWAGIIGGATQEPPVGYDGDRRGVGIRREYQWIGQSLGHAHQAGVSETHRYPCVFPQKRYHGIHVFVQIESRDQRSPRKHRVQCGRAPFAKQMAGFEKTSINQHASCHSRGFK